MKVITKEKKVVEVETEVEVDLKISGEGKFTFAAVYNNNKINAAFVARTHAEEYLQGKKQIFGEEYINENYKICKITEPESEWNPNWKEIPDSGVQALQSIWRRPICVLIRVRGVSPHDDKPFNSFMVFRVGEDLFINAPAFQVRKFEHARSKDDMEWKLIENN